ncbi:MAG: CoA pyrophosphatase [Candidatus Caldarchaeum sp.]|uniref:CoA pyrophosphatase n=1 Tax=Caldiarchaeum subterraneum TaxID=311458 RepID=A0A7C5LEQ0_CALS0
MDGRLLTKLSNSLNQLTGGDEIRLDHDAAAVAIILRENQPLPELLLVKRVSVSTDPWSGQLAFPGGRFKDGDNGLTDTMFRELWEEAGIPRNSVTLLGNLPYISPANYPQMKVKPYVGWLSERIEARPGPEIQRTYWVALDHFKPKVEKVYARSVGKVRKYLCYVFDGEVVWGMTSVLLRRMMSILEL